MKKYILALILTLFAPAVMADLAVWYGPMDDYMDGIWTTTVLFRYYLCPMLLTAAIETFILWIFKEYRKRGILIYFAILNLISNFALNYSFPHIRTLTALTLLELSAVVFEFTLLGIKAGYSKKLFFIILLCNVISFLTGIGLIIMWSITY